MRLLYFTIILLSAVTTKAQVGVNTLSPLGIFHVDPKGDTSTTAGTSDDFIIDNNGRVGINTVTPTASLDIVGNMSVVDGTEGNYNVMTSDADGLGSWNRLTYTTKVDGVVTEPLQPLKLGSLSVLENFTDVGASITLPAGQWQIYFYCIYKNAYASNYTVWWDLWTASARVGRVLSYFAPSAGLSTTYASYAVTASTSTTYRILGCVGRSSVASITMEYDSGARIWAIPIF